MNVCYIIMYMYITAHAKEALDLAKMQEHTEQIKHQEEIRVTHAYMHLLWYFDFLTTASPLLALVIVLGRVYNQLTGCH